MAASPVARYGCWARKRVLSRHECLVWRAGLCRRALQEESIGCAGPSNRGGRLKAIGRCLHFGSVEKK